MILSRLARVHKTHVAMLSRARFCSARQLLFLIAGSYAFTNVFLTPTSKASYEPEVIYGADNRHDLYDPRVNHQLATIARSTGLVTYKEQIADTFNPGVKSFTTKSLLEDKNLCDDEPFAKQPVGGWCSGFLAAPDIFVTAGHCVPFPERCAQIAIVFGFAYEAGAEDLNQLKADDVYSCKNIITQKYDHARGQDYAVLRLDRPVRGRAPLPIRRTGWLENNAALAVIGHPAGLPTKIADGAYVRENALPDYFVTNTDSFGGNSGSAVLNARTGLVEGILVRGERDFDYRGDCMVSYRCQDGNCRGEDAVRTSLFAAHIPAVPTASNAMSSNPARPAVNGTRPGQAPGSSPTVAPTSGVPERYAPVPPTTRPRYYRPARPSGHPLPTTERAPYRPTYVPPHRPSPYHPSPVAPRHLAPPYRAAPTRVGVAPQPPYHMPRRYANPQ